MDARTLRLHEAALDSRKRVRHASAGIIVSRQRYQLAFGRASLSLARTRFLEKEARKCVPMNMAGGRDG
jgi:hypothetical protein